MNAIMDCPMDPNRNTAEVSTVREYMSLLLVTLWREEANFSGKRPLGWSGWEWEVYEALIKAGLVEGTCTVDEDGDVDVNMSTEAMIAADKLIVEAIREVFGVG